MPYTQDKPQLPRSIDELKRTIPGWGVDLDPKDRPAYPKEHFIGNRATGAHWDFPDRQPELVPRERSNEHKFLTPVFGTTCPPSGLSGMIRRYAYKYSEGTTSHWLMLVAADRVNVIESRITGVLRGKPDNLIAESGIVSEFRKGAQSSRFGQHRADLKHQPLDLLVQLAPWILVAGIVMAATKGVRGRRD